jgi:hypothetical protein
MPVDRKLDEIAMLPQWIDTKFATRMSIWPDSLRRMFSQQCPQEAEEAEGPSREKALAQR